MVLFQFPYFSGDESEMQKGGLIGQYYNARWIQIGLRYTSSDSPSNDIFVETQGMLLLFSLLGIIAS